MKSERMSCAPATPRALRRMALLVCVIAAWAGCQNDGGQRGLEAEEEGSGAAETGLGETARAPVAITVGPVALAPRAAPADMEVESCVPEDFRVPVEMTWPAVERDGLSEKVSPSAIELRLQSHREDDLRAYLHLTIDAGGSQEWSVDGPEVRVPAKTSVRHSVDLRSLPLSTESMRTSGMVSVTAIVFNESTGRRELSAASPPLFWHYGTRDTLASRASGALTVYDERTLEQTYHGGDLTGQVPRRFLEEHPDTIPSRVLSGQAPIVTQGRTTPEDLVTMGLLRNFEAARTEMK